MGLNADQRIKWWDADEKDWNDNVAVDTMR